MTRGGTAFLILLHTGCAAHGPVRSPAAMGAVTIEWHPVTSFLDSAVAAGAAHGAVLAISHEGAHFIHGTGQLGADEPYPVSGETVYDLASLTKVVGLTTAAMFAVAEGKLDLDTPVQRYLPAFVGPLKERVTVRLLLAHAGGFQAWRPLYLEAESREHVFQLVGSTPLEYSPGNRTLYSDLGAILLTRVIESVYQERLDSLLARRLFHPLGMSSTSYLPPAEWRGRIAPTELDPWRGRVLRGEVHDENAAVMDGVSGHAGLFGSAVDLLRFAEWALQQAERRRGGAADDDAGRPTASPTLQPSVLREFTRRQDIVPGSSRALGWDTPSSGGSAGSRLSSTSFGHTGFTGTSLWIDPERRLAIALLSNRVNPTRDNPRWAPVRAAVADLVVTTLSEAAR